MTRQIEDARVENGWLVMTRGAVTSRIGVTRTDLFDRALAFAERWDHKTPGAYAARAVAAAKRWRAEQ